MEGCCDAMACKMLEIGDWDMNNDATKAVAHGIVNFLKIVMVSAVIIKDDNSLLYPLTNHIDGVVNADAEVLNIDAINVNLTRKTSGGFNNTDFDATSFNRGFITIFYHYL